MPRWQVEEIKARQKLDVFLVPYGPPSHVGRRRLEECSFPGEVERGECG